MKPLPLGISFIRPPKDTGLCGSCRQLDNADELLHEKLIRCPSCKHAWEPDFEEPVWKEDGGEVYCPECDHEFHVGTMITYTFTSPALIEKGETDD
jgi:hypothetical protein